MTDDGTALPRPEYPRPQFRRDRWLNLNGYWDFEIDRGDSGLERGLVDRPLAHRILVPFAPESAMSGIGDPDFLHAVWYRRTIRVPEEWAGDRVVLHFGAVDHDATVWVGGVEVGRHRGGFASFALDVTEHAPPGSTVPVVLRARDEPTRPQARGKQSRTFAPIGADYGRTTGIWQTVWLEPVPPAALRRPRITPNLAAAAFELELPLTGGPAGATVLVVASDDAGEAARLQLRADLDLTPRGSLALPEGRVREWSPDDPFLYDLRFELRDADGRLLDALDSYAGLRSVAIDGKAVLLNGRTVFQRLVLDQGFYPDSLMTAPTDADLVRDIELSMAAGFNGARLHQKVFEERFLYHADRLGYLLWGEFGDWGCATDGPGDDRQQPDAAYVAEWLEVLERDHSHPSIVGWCPLNETWQRIGDRITALDDVTTAMYLATKAHDTSRPVLDASGYAHRVPRADVYDSHDYEQDPVRFAATHARLGEGRPLVNRGEGPDATWSVPYAGQPYFVSEFGGIWWNPDEVGRAQDPERSWGYGERVRDVEAFHARFAGLVDALLDDPDMFGYCYTQLTDVFQEENGVYRFDRAEKLDVARIRAVQRRPAAIESGPRAGAGRGSAPVGTGP